MAGRRRTRETTETLVACHHARRRALVIDLAGAASPADRVFAAAQYLRGALRRLGRAGTAKCLRPQMDATAREAQEYLTELADRLFEAAIKERRSRR